MKDQKQLKEERRIVQEVDPSQFSANELWDEFLADVKIHKGKPIDLAPIKSRYSSLQEYQRINRNLLLKEFILTKKFSAKNEIHNINLESY